MIYILSALLFSISANIDNLAVGIAYGIRKLKIGLLYSTIIACLSCMGTFIAMLLGGILSNIFPKVLTNSLGSIILIIFGVWSIYISMRKEREPSKEKKSSILCTEILLTEPEKADLDHSGSIEFKESLLLGFALALNNGGMGIGASIAGLNLYLTSSLTFLFSLFFMTLGYHLGSTLLSSFIGKLAGFFAGFVIILLGLCQLFF